MRQWHSRHALIVAQRLHRNIGHPHPLVLEAGAQASIIAYARTYCYPPCLRTIRPGKAPLSTVVQNTTFNDALAAAHGTEDMPRMSEQRLQGVLGHFMVCMLIIVFNLFICVLALIYYIFIIFY